jgi:outer membrane protein TolC
LRNSDQALLSLLVLPACTAAGYREEADAQVYDILEIAAEHVTGEIKTFDIDRPEDTLRRRIEADPAIELQFDLIRSLDVAAENSREFQERKERLYQVALALTREQHDFALRFTGTSSDVVTGVGDDEGALSIRNDLFASRNTVAGGRVVASFVNTFLKDIVHGGSFNGASVLGLSFTQPLLRGYGERIAREPLTQAERDVIYEMRAFERFRAVFAVQVVTSYLRLLEDTRNLASVEANLESTRKDRERVEAMVDASQLPPIDLDRARQSEFTAQDQLNNAIADLESSLDAFKVVLGLPTDCKIALDPRGLEKLQELAIELVDLTEERAAELALQRRYDYRTAIDDVEDAGRLVLVAEDALRSFLDLSTAVALPTDPGNPVKIDWARVEWSAGFDLDLALDRLAERNAYRSALIALEAAMRNREATEDLVKAEVRNDLRNIRRTFTSYQIQDVATRQAVVRRERAMMFLEAGRGDTLALLDAQSDLLQNQINLTSAIVDYAVSRLQLLRDLEGLVMEPKGLRYDPGLPLPAGPLHGRPRSDEALGPAEPTKQQPDDQGGKR